MKFELVEENQPETKKSSSAPKKQVNKSKLSERKASKKVSKIPEKSKPQEDGIIITSDELRTAFYLIQKSSSRGSIKSIFDEMRDFFETHKIIELGYREYQIIAK